MMDTHYLLNDKPRILKAENFNSEGSLNFKSLTIQNCFDLYRDYINDWLTFAKFVEYYQLTPSQFEVIRQVHDYIDNLIYIKQLKLEEGHTMKK